MKLTCSSHVDVSKEKHYSWKDEEKLILQPYIEYEGRIKWKEVMTLLPGRTIEQCNSYINNRRTALRQLDCNHSVEEVAVEKLSDIELNIKNFLAAFRVDSLIRYCNADRSKFESYVNYLSLSEISESIANLSTKFSFLQYFFVQNSLAMNYMLESPFSLEELLLFFEVAEVLKNYIESFQVDFQIDSINFEIHEIIRKFQIVQGDACFVQYFRIFPNIVEIESQIRCLIHQKENPLDFLTIQ